jgi:hypothetical protein
VSIERRIVVSILFLLSLGFVAMVQDARLNPYTLWTYGGAIVGAFIFTVAFTAVLWHGRQP